MTFLQRFMVALTLLTLIFGNNPSGLWAQSCPTGTTQLIVSVRTDNYPRESSYKLQNQTGAVLMLRDTGYFTQANTTYRDTLCIPNTSCLLFTMIDSYGDGLCCGHGNGQYQLFWNGTLTANGGQFTHSDVRSINCGPTQSCSTALAIDTGNHSAPVRNSWYTYQAPTRGRYRISTCQANTGYNTKIWIYNTCNAPVLSNDNLGTIFFNDSSAACG
ncbi:MAG: hypothetical protein ACK4ZC_03550, partial [Bacteroidota bacterium]